MAYGYFYHVPSLVGKLKPATCKSCQDGDCFNFGTCEKCLANQAYNTEYIETHSFIFDTRFKGYHTGNHEEIKCTPLRMPNEHPYLYYGIEVEVEFDTDDVCIYDPDDYDEDEYEEDDCDGDNWKIQDILYKFSEITDGLFVYERDGSLDNGVELISRPCSYAYWTSKDTVEKLKKGFEYLRSEGALVKQPDTNGMHIHISKKFFDKGETKLQNRGEAYESFDWLFQKFQPEFEKLGGRKYTDYCQSKVEKLKKSLTDDYNVRNFNVDMELKCTLKKGGPVPRGDHYSAINMSGNTLEVRVFKSTTDYEQILANIEIVRNISHAVREVGIDKSLDELLHTKDNIYLDRHIQRVRMESKKNGEELDLTKVNDNKIEISVKK